MHELFHVADAEDDQRDLLIPDRSLVKFGVQCVQQIYDVAFRFGYEFLFA